MALICKIKTLKKPKSHILPASLTESFVVKIINGMTENTHLVTIGSIFSGNPFGEQDWKSMEGDGRGLMTSNTSVSVQNYNLPSAKHCNFWDTKDQ